MSESLLDLEALLPSWHLYMRSARLSPRTIATYTAGVKSFLDFCERAGIPPAITKVAAQGWVVDLLDGSAQPATATTWLGALKRYATWLEEEGEIPANPLVGMRTPRVDRKITNALTDEQMGMTTVVFVDRTQRHGGGSVASMPWGPRGKACRWMRWTGRRLGATG